MNIWVFSIAGDMRQMSPYRTLIDPAAKSSSIAEHRQDDEGPA